MTSSSDSFSSKLLLGRYRVVRALGEGGMGTVHLARIEGAEGFTKPVVVKRMRAHVGQTEDGHRLFKREAQILSKMQHPGIVNILDFGVEDGAHIMVLEYVHGYTLAPWLDYRYKTAQALPVDVCLYIIRKVLDALHYAHCFEAEQGQTVEVVHRDVAPDNVLLNKKGYVHLLDFGVASMSGSDRENSTKAGVFRGKLGYAAPETVHGKAATPRSDQYSAAALLWELLTQETPFLSESMGETVQRMLNEIPAAASSRRNDVPSGLDEVIAQALEKEPENRFESAFEFSRQLRRFQTNNDEDVALLLQEMVHVDFERLPEEVGVEALRLREEALAQETPSSGLAPAPHFHFDDDEVTGVELSDPEEHSVHNALTLAPAASSTPAAVDNSGSQKRLHGLLLGILIVGALIALALGAALALLKGNRQGEQVFVVGGENQQLRSSPASEEIEAPKPKAAGQAEAAPTGESASAKSAPENVAAKEAKPAAASVKAAPLSKQQKLSRAVQSQSPAFQSCFSRHLKSEQTAPTATLHFAVDADGGSAKVTVGPAAVKSSSLGQCLHRAASAVSFPALGENVAFSVPVRARVSRQP